jgi:hypothetical protein
MRSPLSAIALLVCLAGTAHAASVEIVNNVGLSGSTITDITINGQVVAVGDLVSGKPTTFAVSTGPVNRVILTDNATPPATNQGVWDTSGDLDVFTGHQIRAGSGPQNYFFPAPLTTKASVDAVILGHADNGGSPQFDAIDALGNIIAEAGTLTYPGAGVADQPTGLWNLPDEDYIDVTAVGAPGDPPAYGAVSNVAPLTGGNGGVGIALNFNPGVQIHGVRITNAGSTLEMSEVLGVLVDTPIPPPPPPTSFGVVNNVSLTNDLVTEITVNNVAIPVANLVSGKSAGMTSAVLPNRIMIRDDAPLPATNADAWNLSGDLDVMTGHQLLQSSGPQEYFFDSPITTGGLVDAVVLALVDAGGARIKAIDASGNVIAEAGTLVWTAGAHSAEPHGIWSTPDTDFIQTTTNNVPGDAPTYGALFNVAPFTGAAGGFGMALKFAPDILIHGISIDSFSSNVELAEVFGVAVSPVLPGDHNGDGAVDAADYVAWRKNPDAFGGDPDGYNDWQENFGVGGGGSSANDAAVPEPLPLVLGSMWFVAMLAARFRTRSEDRY